MERPQGREEIIVDIKSKVAVEFPEDPEKGFEAIFSSVGNSESQCVTWLCLGRSPITKSGLHTKFLTESSYAWRCDQKLQSEYCTENLIPIGLVVEADTLYLGASEYVTGFRLTEAGLRYQPIAAYLLEQSADLPHSLLTYFGQTSTGPGNTRPVLNKINILGYLYHQEEPVKTTEIATTLNLQIALVGKRLRDLRRVGLVKHLHFDTEKDAGKYSLSKETNREDIDNVETVYSERGLTHLIAEMLFELGTADILSMATVLRNRFPDIYADKDPRHFRGRVAKTLRGLAKQGICHGDFGRDRKSYDTITDLGKRIMERIVFPVERALTDESLLLLWRRIPWQTYATSQVAKYSQESGNANRRSLEDWKSDALAIIRENPGIRPEEVKTQLEHNPSDPLRFLLRENKVRKERVGKATRYYPN